MKSKQCYLCRSKKIQVAFKKLGFTIIRCRDCGLFQMDFTGSYSEFIREYYNREFFKGSSNRAGYCDYEGDRAAEEKNMQTYLRGIKRFQTGGTLLDIGCATGLFMLQAQKQGFDVYGIDVSDYATRIAKRRFGKKIKASPVEKARYPENFFDAVTLFDVVEHVQDPRRILTKLHRFLQPDGILVINTGDAGSQLARFQGKDWHFFIPPQHFYNFSRDTLTALLTQSGYQVVRVEKKGKWVSLRYLLHLAKQIQNDFLAKIGLALVKNNRLGRIPLYLNLFDNITVYAKKAPAA